mgnify:CR=1 FL=1
MDRPANIYDVAKHAGVSHQTVSRVLNESEKVAEKTREKVEQAITELGYQRNNAARSLVTSQTRMIGVVMTNTGFFGPNSTMRAMEEQARANGYFAVSVSVDPESPDSIEAGIRQMKDLGVDALVMIAPQIVSLEIARPLLGGIPIVILDHSQEAGLFSVTIDDYLGAKKATRYLVESGHKNLLHVSGPVGWFESDARIRGFEDACKELSIESPKILRGSWESESGYQLAKEVVKTNATAVFCANDQLAIGLMRGLHELGVDIPNEISIVGYDDLPESKYLNPPLTTIRQDFEQLGKRLMTLLLEELAGDTSVRRETIEPELVIRGSVSQRLS